MTRIIESEADHSLEITCREIPDPSGTIAEIYEVFQTINGRRLPIGNGESGSLEAARSRYNQRLSQLRGEAK